MAGIKVKRKVKIPIRKWLAELFGVHSESVSRWIGLGQLRSYKPEDVRAFLVSNPRLLTQDSRVRRMRKDKGVLRPHRRRKAASSRTATGARAKAKTRTARAPARKAVKAARKTKRAAR